MLGILLSYNLYGISFKAQQGNKTLNMARTTSPTFTTMFEIKERPDFNGRFSDLDKISDFYRRAYNATLGHFFKKAKQMKRSEPWQNARKLPKGDKRKKAFESVRKDFGIEKKYFEEYVKNIRGSDLSFFEWTNSAVMQSCVANRAFSAIERYIFAKSKRLRFKEKGFLFSYEGKQNTTGVSLFPKGKIKTKIQGSEFKIEFDQDNPYHLHAYQSRVKYARILIKDFDGKKRYFVQGAFEGLPYENKERLLKHIDRTKETAGKDYYEKIDSLDKVYQGVVGLDFGPRYVHLSTPTHSEAIRLSDNIEQKQSELRCLKRKLDRQRRANNPHNYNEDKTIKKGPKKWVNSAGYTATKSQIASIERRKAATRKASHGYTANRILSYGNIIKTEKISYKGWHRIFGRSIAHHAPSALEGELTRKAGYARGRCERISTFQTALSQMCLCGAKKKKPLSQRIHNCDQCGLEAPRDIFSAYLAIFCHKEIDTCGNEKWSLNLLDAKAMFRGHRHLSESGTNAAPIRSDGKPSKACTSDSASIARGSSSETCDPILESFWQSFASGESGADLNT